MVSKIFPYFTLLHIQSGVTPVMNQRRYKTRTAVAAAAKRYVASKRNDFRLETDSLFYLHVSGEEAQGYVGTFYNNELGL